MSEREEGEVSEREVNEAAESLEPAGEGAAREATSPWAARHLAGARLPHRLRDLPDPPHELFVRGHLPGGPWVAVVGTRRCSKAAARFTRELSGELARAGAVVASGGARGIDRAAHEGALAAGGRTVVVAPSSWELPYPESHRALFRRIVSAGGAHLSEFERGVEPRRHQFFRRNELLAALCHQLVVVEAPVRSGALNAAKWARRLGRPCFVAAAPPWQPLGAGCTAELERGARPLLSADQLIGELLEAGHCVRRPGVEEAELTKGGPATASGASEVDRRAAPGGTSNLHASRVAVLALLARGPEHPDRLCVETGLAPAELSHVALLLTLSGEVELDDRGRLRRPER